MFFQDSLAEVVRKLRTISGGAEEETIHKCIADTQNEVNSPNAKVRITAIQKATYFHMLGYSSTFANFRVVELMASSTFLYKRIAYLAACTSFTEDTDVVPLTTALLKRDLSSSSQYEVGLALYCIASIATPDMAQDVVADVVNLLTHPLSYVRKKATLSLYRIFLNYPESLRVTYTKLKEKLDDNAERCDADPAVRGAVVCVLCELARRNPANFLGLSLPFYSLLSSVHSNWTLIKIVKVFGHFAPLEPRLGKKLVEPLSNLMKTTGAKSVQYECILAVASGMSKVPSITQLASEKVCLFVEDADPNLRFLGLEAMSLLVRDNRKLLMHQRDVVLRLLDDADPTIRLKALVVLRDLTSRKTIVSHITHMLRRAVRSPPDEEWSNAVVQKIIEVAQINDYEWVEDFEWYLGVLIELSLLDIAEYRYGGLVEKEIVVVLARVNGVRRYGVEELVTLLSNARLLCCDAAHSSQWRVICAAAFVCGEYPYWLPNVGGVCKTLLSEAISRLPSAAQLACVTAVGKIAAFVYQPCTRHLELCNGEESCKMAEEVAGSSQVSFADLCSGVLFPPSKASFSESGDTADSSSCGLDRFLHSIYPLVQERSRLVSYQIQEYPEMGWKLYDAELPPVATGAQDVIELPADLDLEAPFCGDLHSLLQLTSSDDEEKEGIDDDLHPGLGDLNLEYRVEQQRRSEQIRRAEMSVYYLRDGGKDDAAGVAVDGEASSPLTAAADGSSTWASGAQRRVGGVESHARRHRKIHSINRNLSKPEGYSEEKAAQGRQGAEAEAEDEATRKLRQIDVTRALRASERLPEAMPYSQILQQQQGGRGGGGGAMDGAAFSYASDELDPVLLFREHQLRLYVTVADCKATKQGYLLKCVFECVNELPSSSVYDVVVRIDSSDAAGGASFQTKDIEDAAATPPVDGASIASKIVSSASIRATITLQLPKLPLDLRASPLPLVLQWRAKRKAMMANASLPLRYTNFARHLTPAMAPTSAEYLNSIVPQLVREGGMHTASVRLPKATMSTRLLATQRLLRLIAIDVYRCGVTLYGQLHTRRSESHRSHVAVLLHQSSATSDELVIAVRGGVPALGAALCEELAEALRKVDL